MFSGFSSHQTSPVCSHQPQVTSVFRSHQLPSEPIASESAPAFLQATVRLNPVSKTFENRTNWAFPPIYLNTHRPKPYKVHQPFNVSVSEWSVTKTRSSSDLLEPPSGAATHVTELHPCKSQNAAHAASNIQQLTSQHPTANQLSVCSGWAPYTCKSVTSCIEYVCQGDNLSVD